MFIEQALKQIYTELPGRKAAVINATCRRGKDYQLQVVAGAYTKSPNFRVGPILSSKMKINTLTSP